MSRERISGPLTGIEGLVRGSDRPDGFQDRSGPQDAHELEDGDVLVCANGHEWIAEWEPGDSFEPGSYLPDECPYCFEGGSVA